MKIFDGMTELVGGTPLLRLNGYIARNALEADICAKLEYFNPAGSVKDRVALAMIEDAERKGLLKPGATLIEPTSGNTGVGLAAVAAAKGYRLIIAMPETMSVERRRLLKAYGSELVLTDGGMGMTGAIDLANERAAQMRGAFIPGLFDNHAIRAAHGQTTAPEIWSDTDGKIDIFVAGVGTGGTLSGVGRYLKCKNKNIRIVAVEPASSPVLGGGRAGAHGIQGIGAGFVPNTLDAEVIDEVIAVKDDDAYSECKTLARTDGVLVGISSGAALSAAKSLARRFENNGRLIVALFHDTGERYLSDCKYVSE